MQTSMDEYTPGQIRGGITRAIQDGNMSAVASLLGLLAVKAPDEAAMIMAAIGLGQTHRDEATS